MTLMFSARTELVSRAPIRFGEYDLSAALGSILEHHDDDPFMDRANPREQDRYGWITKAELWATSAV